MSSGDGTVGREAAWICPHRRIDQRRAFRLALLHPAAAAAVPFVRAEYGVSYTEIGLRAHRLQRRLGRAADAGRIPGRPDRRAHPADRRLLLGALAFTDRRAWSTRSGCSSPCSRSPASATPSITRPTTRCLRTSSRQAHRQGVLDPHLRRHARLGRSARSLLLMRPSGAGAAPSSAPASLGFVGAAAAGGCRATPPSRAGARGEAPPRQRRLAAAAVAADPAQSAVLRAAGDDERRHPQFPVVALGALARHAGRGGQCRAVRLLLLSAIGVLVGGIIADRTTHHGPVAALGLAVTSC